MDLTNIFNKIDNLKNDEDKILLYAKIINYIEELNENICFKNANVEYINIINNELKSDISNILNNSIKECLNQIKFLMYYNNETRNNNRYSRKS